MIGHIATAWIEENCAQSSKVIVRGNAKGASEKFSRGPIVYCGVGVCGRTIGMLAAPQVLVPIAGG